MRFLQVAFMLLSAISASALPTYNFQLLERQAGSKIVTAHFMMGLAGGYTAENWADDINAAKEMGVEAFALNIADKAQDAFTEAQLALAYKTAADLSFKMYISFDFAWFTPDASAVDEIAGILNTYATHPAALKHNNKAVVTTFIGDAFGNNWEGVRGKVSAPLEILPNWQADTIKNTPSVDGAYSWNAWPSQNNEPIAGPMTTDSDDYYLATLKELGEKTYMAAVSPWFFTHFDFSSFQKNWIFASDDLYVNRWEQILKMAPPLLQIVTWNDFGESSYIGPYNTAHADDGASQWTKDFPHDAWRTLSKPYIAAYKAGKETATVTEEKIVYWYRPHPKGLTCSGDALAKPTGAEFAQDKVFVATMLKSPAELVITSGDQAPVTISVKAGIVLSSADMGVGAQSFSVRRGGCEVMSGKGGMEIAGSCEKYNFNAYVGELSASGTCGTPVTQDPPKETGPRPTPTATTSRIPSLPSSTPSPAPSPAPSSVPSSGNSEETCNKGTGEGGLQGLCEFSCTYGYCPTVCTCISRGAPTTPPAETGQQGVPLAGLGTEYEGLCSFTCNHGYCPEAVCKSV